jgi:hypothetical protein
MRFAVCCAETAQPSGAPVVRAMPPEHMVHAVDQVERELGQPPFPGSARQAKKVTDREGQR